MHNGVHSFKCVSHELKTRLEGANIILIYMACNQKHPVQVEVGCDEYGDDVRRHVLISSKYFPNR